MVLISIALTRFLHNNTFCITNKDIKGKNGKHIEKILSYRLIKF